MFLVWLGVLRACALVLQGFTLVFQGFGTEAMWRTYSSPIFSPILPECVEDRANPTTNLCHALTKSTLPYQ
eukprot:4736303-Amphidinium_carterae.1